MSFVLLLLFVGALYAIEYFRRRGEAFAARLTPRTAGGPEFARVPLQVHRPADLERRHAERRSTDRRQAA